MNFRSGVLLSLVFCGSIAGTALLFSQNAPAIPPQGNSAASATGNAVSGSPAQLELVKAPRPVYPLAAQREGIQGQVVLNVAVSKKGDVEKIDVVSGNHLLADAAVHAVRKWKYRPYLLNGQPTEARTTVTLNFAFAGNVENRAPAGARVQLPQGIMAGQLIHKVQPVYPEEARQAKIQGTVLLDAVIGKEGAIVRLKPLSGNPMLIPAAVGAVQQWRYKPYMRDGQPVEVETAITVNFALR
jgi:TonB family protein